MVILKFLPILLLTALFDLNAEATKKIRVYPLLSAQGITKEVSIFESQKIFRTFQELGIETITSPESESFPDRIPSFKQLSEETKSNGGDYFIWGSIRLSGINSFRNFYIVEANSNLTLEEFSIECSDLFCNEEEMEVFKSKIKLFCKSKSIPTQEIKIDFPVNELAHKNQQTRNYNYAKLSFYFPGLGQSAFQKNTKSYLFAGSFLFSLWIGREQNYYSHQYKNQSAEMYAASFFSYQLGLPLTVSAAGLYKASSLEQDSKEFGYSSGFWYFIAGSIYLFNIYDAFYISSDTKLSIQINPSLLKVSSVSDKNVSLFYLAFKKDFDL